MAGHAPICVIRRPLTCTTTPAVTLSFWATSFVIPPQRRMHHLVPEGAGHRIIDVLRRSRVNHRATGLLADKSVQPVAVT